MQLLKLTISLATRLTKFEFEKSFNNRSVKIYEIIVLLDLLVVLFLSVSKLKQRNIDFISTTTTTR